jgi:tetratricopeptide (TPR) repeat protein
LFRKEKILALLAICLYVSVAAQPDPRIAEEFFKKGNYLKAIDEYKKQLKLDRDHAGYNMKLAICYLRTNLDKTKAVIYLERALAQPKHDKEVPYYLAVAYTYDLQFEKAIEKFNLYKNAGGGKYSAKLDKQMEDCLYAKELMKFPKNVKFENLAKVNSEYPDYYPFVTKDERSLAYTARREDGKGSKEFDGYYPSDIWFAKFDGTSFGKGKNAGSTNTAEDEQVVGISHDGEILYIYIDHYTTKSVGDIYECIKKSKTTYGRRKALPPQVNTKELETSASIAPNRQTMFFASNKSGGKGGFDLYMVRKLPNGEWAESQPLPPSINTAGNEDFPTLSTDGKTLFFSSNGHKGMGNYDLYKTTWNPENNTWTDPENLGYPINTPLDDRTISFAGDMKHAYISTLRKDGKGDLDIYRITYNDVEVKPAMFTIQIPSGDSINPFVTDAMLVLYDSNDELYGEYAPNINNGEYTIIIEPGKYAMEIEVDGYDLYTQELKVNEFHAKMGVIRKMVPLSKFTPQ